MSKKYRQNISKIKHLKKMFCVKVIGFYQMH